MIREIWILIARKLSGEASKEELEELKKFSATFEDESPVNLLDQIYHQTEEKNAVDKTVIDRAWNKLKPNLFDQPKENQATDLIIEEPAKRPLKKITLWWLSAAALVLMGVIAYYLAPQQKKPEAALTAMVPPTSGVSKITLPDGSSVWLNSGSKITYRNNEQSLCREVTLTGEAYFDVVKDAAHPFIVTTPSFKIRVLGTAFNVRAYDHMPQSEATLVRGRIELSLLKKPETKYILKPSEKLVINTHNPLKQEPKPLTEKDSTNDYTAVELSKVHEYQSEGLPSEVLWMKPSIDFDDASFSDIAKMMEHKYNVSIRFANEKLSKAKFSGKFKNETLDQAMKELQEVADFHYTIDKDQVLVK